MHNLLICCRHYTFFQTAQINHLEALGDTRKVFIYFMPTSKFRKKKMIWIGSMKYSILSIKTKWKLSWAEIQFKMHAWNNFSCYSLKKW